MPIHPQELSAEFLSEIISEAHPGRRVLSADIIDTKIYGEVNVSSSARATLDLEYDAGAPADLPRRVVVKMSLADNIWPAKLFALFENEVNFYKHIRPELDIETPLSLGGRFDAQSKRYVLILEDVGARGAHFSAQSDEPSVENTQAVLDVHARVHAKFWENPRFETDLSNIVQTHLSGGVEELMHELVREGIREELRLQIVKRELFGRLGMSEAQMYAGCCALKRHQSTLPQTLLHGDSHFGNSYRMPDGTGGLYDWQLSVRGYVMHDITYMINTSLSIELRRKHERDLLAFYRDRLGHHGVDSPPDLETLWLEHRRATLWTFYYGWVPAPLPNYGWELLTIALLRTSAAFEDHETRKAIAEIM